MKELTEKTFDAIKKIEDGVECWSARDLMPILNYDRWENFEKVVDKAVDACENSKHEAFDHFVEVTKMISLGKGDSELDSKWGTICTPVACCSLVLYS